ncbi:MAG: Dak phosphatase [Peptococcaceae bacterium BICA1-7]|nr:MAG: Dak phosphatase [Peptococcaceae bacterium BICA1-7]HBV98155.1 DAK2 domain-containing protein [Desulfotomaculum sp.]
MGFDSFNGKEFLMMLVGSANLLAEHKSEIDALNVFPVPDGDTGTNMYLTFLSGVKEAREKKGAAAGEIAAAMAQGCLLGARGNSGVILSQILSGFAKALEGKSRVCTADVAAGFSEGSEAAYRAVMNPAEGTILTVCKRLAEGFDEGVRRHYDMLRAMFHAYRQAQQALAETPDMLPILKEAGVVDAGGRGLVVILEGILHALKKAAARQELELFDLAASQQKEFIARAREVNQVIQFTYCTEMIVGGRGLPLDQMRRELAPYGDCLMVVGNDETAKVHIHSNHPGLVLECCLKYGALNNVQISNMEEQHRELNSPSGLEKPLGIVSVGQGEGIINIMESLGADSVIPGGQTMNPSTEVILEAINRVRADRVIVLPNNSNVVMAVEQAKKISGKEVEMVKTLNIPQGLAAMLVHNPYGDIGDIARKMAAAAESIKCGEVTRAVRDTQMDGLNISAGDYIAVVEDRILASGTQLHPVVSGLVKTLVAEAAEIVTLYYGAGISGSEAESLAEGLGKEFGELEIELHYGGQPHYQFIISAE